MLNNIGLPGLLLIVIVIINVFAFWKLLPRAGLSSMWSLLTLFPIFNVVLLWVVAFKKWPGDKA